MAVEVVVVVAAALVRLVVQGDVCCEGRTRVRNAREAPRVECAILLGSALSIRHFYFHIVFVSVLFEGPLGIPFSSRCMIPSNKGFFIMIIMIIFDNIDIND